jgi:GNAT superfamily N-acetyltransferase
MTLAELGRSHDGAGPVVPGRGHVSMVFVRPEVWGRGIGAFAPGGAARGRRPAGLEQAHGLDGRCDKPARRLYAGHGYRLTGREQNLLDGRRIVQYGH